ARTHEGRRRHLRGRGAATHPPHAPPARRPRARRHPHRLRHVELRRVHGRHRRGEREVLLGAGGPGRRQHDHDHPGPVRGGERRQQHLAPGAEGLPGAPRAAVRLLHARHDHGDGRPAQAQPLPERGRGPARARGQPVPLHRLPEHRQGRPVGRLRAARGGPAARLVPGRPRERHSPDPRSRDRRSARM
ncbi:MAG: Aerobic carbon monoxide dehydrogenase (quinone), small chain, partial [uncultured Frankineae bacterium]